MPAAEPADISVHVGIVPIPDGASTGGKLRLSLVLAPTPDAGPAIALPRWPEEVAKLCTGLTVTFSHGGKTMPIPPEAITVKPGMGTGANRLWRNMFSAGRDFTQEELALLRAAMLPSAPAGKDALTAMARRGYGKLDESATVSYSAAHAAAVFGALRDAVISATVRTRLFAAQPEQMAAAAPEDKRLARMAARMRAESAAPFRHGYARAALTMLAGSVASIDPMRPFSVYNSDGTSAGRLSIREITRYIQAQRVKRAGARLPDVRVKALDELDGVIGLLSPALPLKSFTGSGIGSAPRKVRDAAETSLLDLDEGRLAGGVAGYAAAPGLRVVAGRYDIALYIAVLVDQFEFSFAQAKGTQRRREALAPRKEQEAIDRARAVSAKYATVRSYPTLGKALNFIVDLEIDRSAAGLGTALATGVVSVGFGGMGSSGAASAAFAYEKKQETTIFRPQSRSDADVKKDAQPGTHALPLQGGMVHLAEERFSLSVVDVHSAVNANKLQIQEYTSALANSSDTAAASVRTVEERGRGIQLLDHEADQSTTRLVRQLGALRTGVEAAATPAAAAEPLYAEDMVLGYRVFVRRKVPTKTTTKVHSWLSLMARKVRFDAIGQHYGAWWPYRDFPEREHAYLRPLPRIEAIAGDARDPVTGAVLASARAAAPAHVFSWLGDSLGLPPPGHPEQVVVPQGHAPAPDQVGIQITVSEADPAKYKIPVLRCGSSYQFALAPVYANGGGPTLAEFEASEAGSASWPGEGGGEAHLPFRYGPPNDIDAPRLLVGRDDPLVQSAQATNEAMERVVLRSGGGQDRDLARRFFAPPRADFDRVEQFGVFDGEHSDGRTGAFAQYRLDGASGDFPMHAFPDSETGVLVLEPRHGASTPKHPYFPDPLARNLGFAFERDGKRAGNCPATSPARAFWPRTAARDPALPLQARPITLEIRRGHDKAGVCFADAPGMSVRGGGPSDKLVLHVAPAEEVTVWTWCWPDLDMLARARPMLGKLLGEAWTAHAALLKSMGIAPSTETADMEAMVPISDYLARVAMAGNNIEELERGIEGETRMPGMARFLQTRRQALEEILFQIPLSGINGWRKFTVVHAVVKPLAVPSEVQIQAVRLHADTPFAAWAGAAGKKWTGADDPGGTRIYLGGSMQFDRASTRAIRIEANWPLLDYALAVRRVKCDGVMQFEDRPPRRDQILVDITDIPRAGGEDGAANANTSGLLDLFRDEKGALRELLVRAASTGAASTAARRMDVRVVATSRFTDDFTREDKPVPGKLGKFETQTRAALLEPQDCARREVVSIEVVLPATARPPVPVVTQIDWIMPEQAWLGCGDRAVMRKSTVPRLYLDESWRTSGENELLAVVFEPEPGFTAQDVNLKGPRTPLREAGHAEMPASGGWCGDVAEQIRRTLSPAFATERALDAGGGDKVPRDGVHTRWGADPAAAIAARLETRISPQRFSGYCGAVASQQLPLPGTPVDAVVSASLFATVLVLLYQPQVDPESGRWYVDIGIDPGLVPTPFVRLSLSRYQPDALRRQMPAVKKPDGSIEPGPMIDLRLSPPLLLDPFLVASPRVVELGRTLVDGNHAVTATVYGVGYMARDPAGALPGEKSWIEHPLQNFELMRMSTRHPRGLVRAYDQRGRPQLRRQVVPAAYGQLLVWTCRFDLPVDAAAEPYAVVIDEIDMHVSDDVIERRRLAPDIEPSQANKPVTTAGLVERPSFFSLTLDVPAAAVLIPVPMPE